MFLGMPPAALLAQQADPSKITFDEYNPKSTLVVPEHPVTRAKFPFIDIHNHQQNSIGPERVDKLIGEMDGLNMQIMVNLSGGSGDWFKRSTETFKTRYPNRFALFANFTFIDIDAPDYPERVAATLENDIKGGAQGLKIFKNFGMDLKDSKGQRPHVDDPRWDKAFQVCAKYKVPVLIHTAEPRAFFDPLDKNNERLLELTTIPGRRRPPERYPPWQTLMDEQHALFRRHKNVNFINAHLGWYGNDLTKLASLMDSMPNMHTELGAVLYELGRQPRHARAFFLKYGDRVLMGKDTYNAAEYHVYFRVLETADEYIEYYRRRHAFWRLYGLDLPDDVLKKVYYKNALKLVPRLDAKPFPK